MTLSVDDIMLYAKDNVDLNILLNNTLQSSEPLVELAMRLAVSMFNGVTPITYYSTTDFPNDTILLYGTLHHLANSEAERQLRNQIDFTTQGLNVGVDNKYQQYASLAASYRQMFDTETKALKAYINAENAWGESYSPYSNINEFRFRD